MKTLIKVFSLYIYSGLLFTSQTSAVEIFKDDKNSVALRGYITGVYHSTEDTDDIDEGSSRWGIDVNRNLDEEWIAGATLEWGMNFDKNTDLSIGGASQAPSGSADDAIFTRLGYIHFSHDKWGTVGIGKQWSAFYDMVAGSDVLHYWGGSASGAFNLNSDGGISGTGRVEQAIVWRKSYSGFKIALQIQAQDEAITIDVPEDHPNASQNGQKIATIGNGYGASLLYAWGELTFGLGFNTSDINIESNFNIAAQDDTISAFSITYGSNRAPGVYSSALVTSSENHEIDDQSQFLDTVSSEFVLKYTLDNGLGVYGGFNHIEEDDSDYDGEYEFHYNFVGIEYTIFNGVAILFTEVRLEDTTSAAGVNNDNNQVAAGITVYL